VGLPELAGLRTLRFDARRRLDLEAFKMRRAEESDVDEVIREPFLLYERDRLLVAYFLLGDDPECAPELDALWRVLPRIRYSTAYRTTGLRSTSKTFGYLPRLTIRRDFCTATSFADDQPDEHNVVTAGARLVGRYYKLANPRLYAQHRDEARRVDDAWQIEQGPFTSGIVNKNNPLRYHFDHGNFRSVWSGMLGFKRQIGGGYLNLPEFGVAAEIADRSLLLFDGQGILHGVTPIRRLSPRSLRFTIVYYSMKGMWHCDPLGSELERIRGVKTQREYRRAGRAPAPSHS
jgi:2-oxoglutarate-Fe(II)-dependent dioxygenase family protein